VLTIDLTNRCNMMCDPCFMDANQVGFVHELTWDEIKTMLELAGLPKSGQVALMDGRMAWAGASEIAKGVNSGMEAVKALSDKPALVFLTDGHESPPVNPRYRPNFTVARGEVRGLLVGVGGDEPLPIPKFDPGGHAVGAWGADEVLQIDPRSIGRGGSVGGEQMVEPEDATVKALPGVTPGTEHLSALREDEVILNLRDGNSSALLREASHERSRHVVMPLRL